MGLFYNMFDFLKSEDTEDGGIVQYRRNGSPYVDPDELLRRAGADAIVGDVGKSLDELEQKNQTKK